MNKRIGWLAGAAVALAAAGIGGVAAASGPSDDDGTERPISGSALERAKAAALDHLGGGTVTGTEVDDEESKYEVEVRTDGGKQVDVQLDENFRVVGQEGDDAGEDE